MIIFNYGVMNSAKTVNLICKAYELKQRGFQYVCFKPSIDTRTEGNIIKSRAGLEIDAFNISNTYQLSTKIEECIQDGIKYILLDEIQFFSKESIDVLVNYSIMYNLNILCYGLLTDFKVQLFPASKRLVEVADKLHHIESYCECGNVATINARFNKHGHIVVKGNQIEVGAEDKYITLCKRCFVKKTSKSQ